MQKFIVVTVDPPNSKSAEIIAVCKTANQAFEIVAAEMKKETNPDEGFSSTRWFRVAKRDIALPGFE